jgi:hypothetical protein
MIEQTLFDGPTIMTGRTFAIEEFDYYPWEEGELLAKEYVQAWEATALNAMTKDQITSECKSIIKGANPDIERLGELVSEMERRVWDFYPWLEEVGVEELTACYWMEAFRTKDLPKPVQQIATVDRLKLKWARLRKVDDEFPDVKTGEPRLNDVLPHPLDFIVAKIHAEHEYGSDSFHKAMREAGFRQFADMVEDGSLEEMLAEYEKDKTKVLN